MIRGAWGKRVLLKARDGEIHEGFRVFSLKGSHSGPMRFNLGEVMVKSTSLAFTRMRHVSAVV